MFKTVGDTMVSNKVDYYKPILNHLFMEFIDLKYVLDPQHEQDVLSKLVYNLGAYAVCKYGVYVDGIWRKAYNREVFEVDTQSSMTARDYADLIEGIAKRFDSSDSSTLELIRMTVCYGKCKGFDLKKSFEKYAKSLENFSEPI